MSSEKRPTVALIIGAGASVTSGAPSTTQLSEAVLNALRQERLVFTEGKRRCEPSQTADLLCDALAIPQPDFETVASVIEVLMSYSASPVSGINRFTVPVAKYNALFESLIQHEMHRRVTETIVNAFLSISLNAEQALAQKSLTGFIGKIRNIGRIVLATLNYDDFLDSALDWKDGFRQKSLEETFSRFDPALWAKQVSSEDHLLMHLHGSVHYGFDRNMRRAHEPVHYRTVQDAARAVIGVYQSPQTADDAYLYATPFIMGGQKSSKLVHNPRPYSYYAATALEQIAAADKLVVIGYGFRDQHINQWIDQWLLEGRHNGLVIVSHRTGCDLGGNKPLERFLRLNVKDGSMNSEHIVARMSGDAPTKVRGRMGNLFLVADGVPMNDQTQSELISYLLE